MIAFTTVSGHRFDLSRPDPSDFTIPDIATGLSNICRFNGQVREFYSVAQHSMLVSQLVPSYLRRRALLHDASEAYLGDLSRHLKHSDRLAGYREFENRLQGVIDQKFFGQTFGHTGIHHNLIKLADDLAAVFEHTTLRRRERWHAIHALESLTRIGFIKAEPTRLAALISLADMRLPDGVSFEPMPSVVARRKFLLTYDEVSTLT